MPLTLEAVVYLAHNLISDNTTHLTIPWAVDQSASPTLQEWRIRYRLPHDIEQANERYATYHAYITTTGIASAPRGTIVSDLRYTFETIGVKDTARGSILRYYLEFVLSRLPASAARIQRNHGVPAGPFVSDYLFRLHYVYNSFLEKTDVPVDC